MSKLRYKCFTTMTSIVRIYITSIPFAGLCNGGRRSIVNKGRYTSRPK